MADSDALSIVPSAASSTSNSALRALKDRSAVRRKLLAQTLGVNSPSDLPILLGTSAEHSQPKHERRSSDRGELSDFNESPPFYAIERRRESTPLGAAIGLGASSPEIVANNDHLKLNDGQALIIAKRVTDSGSEQKPKRRKAGDPVDSDGEETIMEPFDDYFQVLLSSNYVFLHVVQFLVTLIHMGGIAFKFRYCKKRRKSTEARRRF